MAEIKNFNPIDDTGVFTILNGNDTSDTFDLFGARLVAILYPDAMTGANLNIEGSLDGTNFFNLFNTTGIQLIIPVTTSGLMLFLPSDLAGLRFVRFKSDATELADRTITGLVRPL